MILSKPSIKCIPSAAPEQRIYMGRMYGHLKKRGIKTTMGAENLYHNNLQNAKAPGLGCHSWIMSTANLGTFAGLSGEEIFSDIRRSIPVGNRKVSDHEITEAINKALSDHRDGNVVQQPRPASPIKDSKAALHRIIVQSTISDEVDLWEMSPIRLWDGP